MKEILMPIFTLNIDSRNKALDLLQAGQLVALPTETVYGLAADSFCGDAIAQIFAIKGRPHFNPLIAHISGFDMAAEHAHICDLSQKLMEKFWPGPLTIVLPSRKDSLIHPLVRAGLDTIALRQPKGVVADLAEQLDRPIAAPSANRSGFLSPTTAQAVQDDLGASLPLILDGGRCSIGVESTIVQIIEKQVILLRPGGVTVEEIEDILNINVQQKASHAIIAPGMMESHYAPNALVKMMAQQVQSDEVLLAFGSQRIAGAEQAVTVLNLSEQGDLLEASVNLFDYLHQLDQDYPGLTIVVEPIPMQGLGLAINDRLCRAAAPRP